MDYWKAVWFAFLDFWGVNPYDLGNILAFMVMLSGGFGLACGVYMLGSASQGSF